MAELPEQSANHTITDGDSFTRFNRALNTEGIGYHDEPPTHCAAYGAVDTTHGQNTVRSTKGGVSGHYMREQAGIKSGVPRRRDYTYTYLQRTVTVITIVMFIMGKIALDNLTDHRGFNRVRRWRQWKNSTNSIPGKIVEDSCRNNNVEVSTRLDGNSCAFTCNTTKVSDQIRFES